MICFKNRLIKIEQIYLYWKFAILVIIMMVSISITMRIEVRTCNGIILR